MRKKFWDTAAFRRTQALWYRRLYDAGFEDLEVQDRRSVDTRNAAVRDREAVTTYYRIAAQLLHEGEFASARDRAVWEMHVEGLSRREIARKMTLNHKTVDRVIHRYRELAGLRRGQRTLLRGRDTQ